MSRPVEDLHFPHTDDLAQLHLLRDLGALVSRRGGILRDQRIRCDTPSEEERREKSDEQQGPANIGFNSIELRIHIEPHKNARNLAVVKRLKRGPKRITLETPSKIHGAIWDSL